MRCAKCGREIRRDRPDLLTTWFDETGDSTCDQNVVKVMEVLTAKGSHVPDEPVGATKVEIVIEGARYDLLAHEVYPDGVPNPSGFWSAETLAADVGLQYSTVREFVADWMLEDDLSVTFIDDQERSATVKFGRR